MLVYSSTFQLLQYGKSERLTTTANARSLGVVLDDNMLFDVHVQGADPGFFLGWGALVSCSTSTPTNHIVLFFAEYSCIRKPQVISGVGGGGGCAHPLHPPPRSAPDVPDIFRSSFYQLRNLSKIRKYLTQ